MKRILCLLVIFIEAEARGRCLKNVTRERCPGVYDCFPSDGDAFDPERLLGEMMFLAENTQYTEYHLYTRKNPNHYQTLVLGDENSILHSTFNGRNPTKMLVHGYRRNADDDWAQMVKGALLKLGEFNVITVDWSKAAIAFYPYAIVNAYRTSKEIAKMVSFLNDVGGSDLSQFHLIGTTLGAQVVSYAGKQLNKVGRVTGLDPAAPGFVNNPPSHRIDIGDAILVDIIHTNAEERFKGYGLPQPVSHVDVYPNGGINQPGCLDSVIDVLTKRDYERLPEAAFCSHRWANFLFIDSILNPQCPNIAYACKDWDTFLEGRCADCGPHGQDCAVLGLRADEYIPSREIREPRKYFLKTNSQWPYCVYHYQVIVKLARVRSEVQYGTLYLTLDGKFDRVSTQLSRRIETFVPGEIYVYLVTSPRDIGPVVKGSAFWLQSVYNVPHTTDPKLFIETIHVKSMSTPFGKQQTVCTLCGNTEDPAVPNLDVVLSKCSRGQAPIRRPESPRLIEAREVEIQHQPSPAYQQVTRPQEVTFQKERYEAKRINVPKSGNGFDYRYFKMEQIKSDEP